jgi:outer membrane lipoprotein-sorting protein
MKKILLITTAAVCFASMLFADTAENLLKKVYDNNRRITSLDINEDSSTTETVFAGNRKYFRNDSKHILFKNPGKMKIARNGPNAGNSVSNSMAAGKTSTAATAIINKDASMHPDCLFNAEVYFKNFNVKIMNRDERIKRGGEEIVATRKEQKTEFPQIRIFIRDNKVREIKFYSATGRKYYEIKVADYATINGLDVPSRIKENVFTSRNKIETDFNYGNIALNTDIPDSSFK